MDTAIIPDYQFYMWLICNKNMTTSQFKALTQEEMTTLKKEFATFIYRRHFCLRFRR